jgi:hypothetical protein
MELDTITFAFLWCLSIAVMGFGLWHVRTSPDDVTVRAIFPYAACLYGGFVGAVVFCFLAVS